MLARETSGRDTRQPHTRALAYAASLSAGAALFLLIAGGILSLGGSALFAGVTFTSTAGRLIRTIAGTGLIFLGLIQLNVLPVSFYAVEEWGRPLLRRQAKLRRERPALGFGVFGFGYLLAGFG